MSARRLCAAIVTAAAAVLLLSGCQPGQAGGTGPAGGCDPHGIAALQPQQCRDGDSPQDIPQAGFGPADGVDPDLFAVHARHEAGHVAAAREFGWSITSVRLRPDGSGRTTVWGFALKDPQQRLVFLYAGAAAAGSSEGAGQDYADAARILARVPAADRDRMEEAARARAARIVAARAGQIDRDAAVLRRDGRLS